MIFLTKLDGTQLVVNDDQILYLERTPDTVITLATGARIMVREPLEVVVERSAEFRRRSAPPHVKVKTHDDLAANDEASNG